MVSLRCCAIRNSVRGFFLGSMIKVDYGTVKPDKLECLYFRTFVGKTNTTSREDFFAITCHKDLLQCALFGMAVSITTRCRIGDPFSMEEVCSMAWYD